MIIAKEVLETENFFVKVGSDWDSKESVVSLVIYHHECQTDINKVDAKKLVEFLNKFIANEEKLGIIDTKKKLKDKTKT